jgi:KDO2-lipid IV(A) lauroyltransferase
VFKTRRGHYTSSFELVTKNPMSYAHGELVIEINRILEKDIYQQPEIWLWSHKRWKHSKPVA